MKKMDEMELSLTLNALKWSWCYLILALFAWCIWSFIQYGEATLPGFLLSTQFIIYFITLQIGKMRVGDESGRQSLVWYMTTVIILLLVFGVLLYFWL